MSKWMSYKLTYICHDGEKRLKRLFFFLFKMFFHHILTEESMGTDLLLESASRHNLEELQVLAVLH